MSSLYIESETVGADAGAAAKQIADFAARLYIPVIRFVSDSSVTEDALYPLYERPAVLVFANKRDQTSFADSMSEAVRLVSSPSR